MIRSLNKFEELCIKFLSKNAYYDIDDLKELSVFVIDEEYGSIRSSHLEQEDKVFSFAECQFNDSDSVPVVIILLIDNLNKFGELIFWKADGSKIKKIPTTNAQLHSFKLT